MSPPLVVAVTGAGGFVGGNLVRELVARGHRVRALVRENRAALAGVSCEEVRGALDDAASLARLLDGAEVVIHLAAKISLASWERRALHATNVLGTRAVCEACVAARVRLVHVSSIHAFAAEPHELVVDESRGPALATQPYYDQTKALGAAEVVAARARGLSAIIVNPTAQIGPNDFRPSQMGQLFCDLATGKLPAVVAGGFNWVDVRDVVACLARLAEAGAPSDHYLLGGHHATLAELAALVAAHGGKPAPRLVTPVWLAKSVAPFAELAGRLTRREPALSRAAVEVLQNHQRVSYARATAELDYRPRPLTDTVGEVLADFRQRGILK